MIRYGKPNLRRATFVKILFSTKLKVIIYSNITRKNKNKILKNARVIGKKGLRRVRINYDCNTIALPRSSTIHTVNARGSIILLAGGFLS